MSLDTSRTPRLVGHYELLSMIAEGGMGAVYRGRNVQTGEIVAIKIVPQDTARNPLLLKRFEQEFKAASLIDHPNVVKALDYCGTGPTPFLVMEFVDGESLGQRVERDGRFPEAEAVRLIGQVCEGLHRAHKQGLIHRDVKPDNIMVTAADAVAKLTDLGLVKDMEGELNLTRTGRGLGTPHFMAPEQFRNAKNADVRCDVYSLGATLYTLLTGVVPFEKTSPLDCWMKKTKNDFPPPKTLAPDVSDRVDWAVCRAMSADPARRPVSCREFMEDLLGAGWRATAPGITDSIFPPPLVEDLWYLVYRDATSQLHTVKGNTESVRRNIASRSLGDVNAILVSRTKTGQFLPLRNVPEFRDLAVGPMGANSTPTGRLVHTAFDQTRGGSRTNLPQPGSGSATRAAGASGVKLPHSKPAGGQTPEVTSVEVPRVFPVGPDVPTVDYTSAETVAAKDPTPPETPLRPRQPAPARPPGIAPWVLIAIGAIGLLLAAIFFMR